MPDNSVLGLHDFASGPHYVACVERYLISIAPGPVGSAGVADNYRQAAQAKVVQQDVDCGDNYCGFEGNKSPYTVNSLYKKRLFLLSF